MSGHRDLLKQAMEQRKRADIKRKKRERNKQIESQQADSSSAPKTRAGRTKHVRTSTPVTSKTDNTKKKNIQTHLPFDQMPPVEIDPVKEEEHQIQIAKMEQAKFEQEVKQNLQHGKVSERIQQVRKPKHTVSSKMKDEFEDYFFTVRANADRIVLKNPKGDITNLNIRKITERVLKKFGTQIDRIESLKQNKKGFRIYVK